MGSSGTNDRLVLDAMSPGAIKAPAFFDPISQAKLSGGQTGREEEEDGAQHACTGVCHHACVHTRVRSLTRVCAAPAGG